MLSRSFCLGLCVFLIAFLYNKWKDGLNGLDNQEQSIITFWNSSIKEPDRQFKRIVVGTNCNLDLIVSGVDLLEALLKGPGDPQDSVHLATIEDLVNAFTHFFVKGSAAERAFTSANVFKEIIRAAENLQKKHYIGGNAALMAVKIAELYPDAQVQLVGPVGPALKDLIPSNIIVPDNSLITEDEVHLIMEYGLNEQWGNLRSPVANRFITSYDESNSKLTMLNTFFKNLKPFNPDLLILSGLHLIEVQTHAFVKEKLEAVRIGLGRIPRNVPVHLELASMANEDTVTQIMQMVASEVSSIGLNEQELTFASFVGGGPHASYYHEREGQPEIHKISDMVLWLLKTYGYSKKNPTSRLTRVHFHSLTYHIIGSLPDVWFNFESAVAGTRIAGRQACDTKALSPEDIELRIPKTFKLFSGSHDIVFDEKRPVFSWEKDGFHFVFSPVLVCINPSKTVGLGDAISATGLMYSSFKFS